MQNGSTSAINHFGLDEINFPDYTIGKLVDNIKYGLSH
jgi:Cdc6-like AAA superfamily ATPase